MYKAISLMVAVALVAAVAPGMQAEETSYADRNIAWLLENFPELEGFSEEGLEAFGERSERADLSTVMGGSGGAAGTYAGDVWIIGPVSSCPAGNVIAPGHGQYVPADPQLWLYPDPVQQVSATGTLDVISWTTKDGGLHASTEITGVTDNFCFLDPFLGVGIYFPYINGVVVGS